MGDPVYKTDWDFKKSLSKDQREYYENMIRGYLEEEEKYYQTVKLLRKEINILMLALDFEPIGTAEQLAVRLYELTKKLKT